MCTTATTTSTSTDISSPNELPQIQSKKATASTPPPPPPRRPPPPPPSIRPPPPPPGKNLSPPLPKLKQLHWDKVRATPDRSTVWDNLTTSSFEFDEEMIVALFGYNTKKNDESRNKTRSPTKKHILEQKRLQNLNILLKALNVTPVQACEALIQGRGLSLQQLETLVKMVLTKEEESNFLNYQGDINELDSVEIFLKAMLTVPFAFARVDAMLFQAIFEDEVIDLGKSFTMLEDACKELRSSRSFLKLLEAVLKTGNRMNDGTTRGGARSFKLDVLLKLADVKGTDGKTTLLHFVVQEMIRSQGIRESGHDLVSGLCSELCNVAKTAKIDLSAIASSVSNLSDGMLKHRHLVQDDLSMEQNSGFVQSMRSFFDQAQRSMEELQENEDKVLSHIKEITEYFHGCVSKDDEVNPLRTFVIVSDFLRILDQVSKELKILKTKVKQHRAAANNSSLPERLDATSLLTQNTSTINIEIPQPYLLHDDITHSNLNISSFTSLPSLSLTQNPKSNSTTNSKSKNSQIDESRTLEMWASKLSTKRIGKTKLRFISPTKVNGEPVIHLQSSQFGKIQQKNGSFIIGSFVSKRKSFEFVKGIVNKAWKLKRKVTMKFYGRKSYSFAFEDEEDKAKTLAFRNFHVASQLFLVRPWKLFVEADLKNFESIPFWVLFKKGSEELWNGDGFSRLASAIGDPLFPDKKTKQKSKTDCARICIEVKATSTFHTVVPVMRDKKRVFRVTTKYNWRPPSCIRCKVFGHNQEKKQTIWVRKETVVVDSTDVIDTRKVSEEIEEGEKVHLEIMEEKVQEQERNGEITTIVMPPPSPHSRDNMDQEEGEIKNQGQLHLDEDVVVSSITPMTTPSTGVIEIQVTNRFHILEDNEEIP